MTPQPPAGTLPLWATATPRSGEAVLPRAVLTPQGCPHTVSESRAPSDLVSAMCEPQSTWTISCLWGLVFMTLKVTKLPWWWSSQSIHKGILNFSFIEVSTSGLKRGLEWSLSTLQMLSRLPWPFRECCLHLQMGSLQTAADTALGAGVEPTCSNAETVSLCLLFRVWCRALCHTWAPSWPT